MLASVSFILGILIAVTVLFLTRSDNPGLTGWLSLGFGLTASASLAIGAIARMGIGFNLLSILSGFAGAILGIGTLSRRIRGWQAIAGLATSLIPALFWLAFAAASIISGGD